MYKRLLVVSDTALYKHEGKSYGFNAVVKELEAIQDKFEEIIWIGTNQTAKKGDGTLIEIKIQNVTTILIPKMGGKSIYEVLKIIILYPYLFLLIVKQVRKAEVIHTRLPSHPGFIAVLISSFFTKKIWWNKFAGSWIPANLPFFYKFQRTILIYAKHSKVTINGFWKDQPSHCFSFENPCLLETDIRDAAEVVSQKKFESPFTFVFVGRLDAAKGVDKIIEALKQIPTEQIKAMHFIGDGTNNEQYQERCKFIENKVFFHGFLPTEKVREILKESDFMLLPSKSEGFPKVIAEAACYGVIPIVSDVGSISHYINATNGFIWNFDGEQKFGEILANAIAEKPEKLLVKSKNLMNVAKMFTFENYRTKLEKYIFTKIKK